jgi:arabinofuranosyltransferase
MDAGARDRIRLWVALTPLIVVVGLLAAQMWFVCDDAYISFRYARHLAEGQGLRFNPGESPPVEGYSNFLWVVIAAFAELMRIPPTIAMPVVSIGCAAGLLLAVARATSRLGGGLVGAWLAGLTFVLAPGTAVWSTSGLETMAEALLLFLTFDRYVLARGEPAAARQAAVAALLLSLVRTEGVAWAAVVFGLGAALRLWDGRAAPGRAAAEAWREVGAAVGAAGAVYAAYAMGRYLWFGSLIANTAYVKVDIGVESALRGLDYVAGFWLSALAPPVQLLLAIAGARLAGARGLLTLAMAAGVPLYAVLVGGDFMTMGRLLVPGTAFVATLVGLAAGRAWAASRGPGAAVIGLAAALAGLGVLPVFDVNLVPRSVRDDFRVRFNSSTFRTEHGQWEYMRDNAKTWSLLGRALAQIAEPGDAIVLGAIGAVGYHNELFVHDRYGLVSPEVARRDTSGGERRRSPGHDKYVAIAFFLDQNPRFLRAEVVRGRPADTSLAKRMGDWRAERELGEHHGPASYPIEIDGQKYTLIVLERMDDPAAAWARFGKGKDRDRSAEGADAEAGAAPPAE